MSRFLPLIAVAMCLTIEGAHAQSASQAPEPRSVGAAATGQDRLERDNSKAGDEGKKEARKERRSHRKSVQHRARRRG